MATPTTLNAISGFYYSDSEAILQYPDDQQVEVFLWVDKNKDAHEIAQTVISAVTNSGWRHPSFDLHPLSILRLWGQMKDFCNRNYSRIQTQVVKTFASSKTGTNNELLGIENDEAAILLWGHFARGKKYYRENRLTLNPKNEGRYDHHFYFKYNNNGQNGGKMFISVGIIANITTPTNDNGGQVTFYGGMDVNGNLINKYVIDVHSQSHRDGISLLPPHHGDICLIISRNGDYISHYPLISAQSFLHSSTNISPQTYHNQGGLNCNHFKNCTTNNYNSGSEMKEVITHLFTLHQQFISSDAVDNVNDDIGAPYKECIERVRSTFQQEKRKLEEEKRKQEEQRKEEEYQRKLTYQRALTQPIINNIACQHETILVPQQMIQSYMKFLFSPQSTTDTTAATPTTSNPTASTNTLSFNEPLLDDIKLSFNHLQQQSQQLLKHFDLILPLPTTVEEWTSTHELVLPQYYNSYKEVLVEYDQECTRLLNILRFFFDSFYPNKILPSTLGNDDSISSLITMNIPQQVSTNDLIDCYDQHIHHIIYKEQLKRQKLRYFPQSPQQPINGYHHNNQQQQQHVYINNYSIEQSLFPQQQLITNQITIPSTSSTLSSIIDYYSEQLKQTTSQYNDQKNQTFIIDLVTVDGNNNNNQNKTQHYDHVITSLQTKADYFAECLQIAHTEHDKIIGNSHNDDNNQDINNKSRNTTPPSDINIISLLQEQLQQEKEEKKLDRIYYQQELNKKDVHYQQQLANKDEQIQMLLALLEKK